MGGFPTPFSLWALWFGAKTPFPRRGGATQFPFLYWGGVSIPFLHLGLFLGPLGWPWVSNSFLFGGVFLGLFRGLSGRIFFPSPGGKFGHTKGVVPHPEVFLFPTPFRALGFPRGHQSGLVFSHPNLFFPRGGLGPLIFTPNFRQVLFFTTFSQRGPQVFFPLWPGGAPWGYLQKSPFGWCFLSFWGATFSPRWGAPLWGGGPPLWEHHFGGAFSRVSHFLAGVFGPTTFWGGSPSQRATPLVCLQEPPPLF